MPSKAKPDNLPRLHCQTLLNDSMQSIKLSGANISNTKGDILVLDKPFSFWGGIDINTAIIVDIEQICVGQNVAGKIVIANGIKGCIAGPGALLEWITSTHAPKAIISTQFEPVLYSAFSMAQLLAEKKRPHSPALSRLYQ